MSWNDNELRWKILMNEKGPGRSLAQPEHCWGTSGMETCVREAKIQVGRSTEKGLVRTGVILVDLNVMTLVQPHKQSRG